MLAALQLLAQHAVPALDGMYWLNLASRILHILGAMILVGGFFYLRTVVMPSPAATQAKNVDEKFGGLRAKWAMWVGIATLLLLATGLWNFIYIVRNNEPMGSAYHMLFGLKLIGGLALFLLAALVAGRSVGAEVVRGNMRLWVSVCLALGILVAALGSVLRTFPHQPKLDVIPSATVIAPAAATPAP